MCRLTQGALVLDLALGGADPLSMLERVASAVIPGTTIILLSDDDLGVQTLRRASALGVMWFLLLHDAVLSILTAGSAAPGKTDQLAEHDVPGGRPAETDLSLVGTRLSPREIEVLTLASHGRRTKQIATELGVAQDTVETLLRRASRKLDASSRTHAVAIAMRLGLLGTADR